MDENKSTFDEWALVELFGHQRIVGKVTEATIGGGAFIRVDVPNGDGSEVVFTRFFGPSAIYSMSPIAKDVAAPTGEAPERRAGKAIRIACGSPAPSVRPATRTRRRNSVLNPKGNL